MVELESIRLLSRLLTTVPYHLDMPDLEDAENIDRLKSWKGDWAALGSIKFMRIRQDGDRRESVFPPKGGA